MTPRVNYIFVLIFAFVFAFVFLYYLKLTWRQEWSWPLPPLWSVMASRLIWGASLMLTKVMQFDVRKCNVM